MGVAIATGGALLLYAAFTDQNPLEALREIASGAPAGVPEKAPPYVKGSSGAGQASFVGQGPFPQLAQAVQAFAGDIYSQARRWQPGYSDCSSFVGKGLKALGVSPPGPSTTLAYLASRSWRRVSRGEAGAGDVAVNTGHMIVFTGPNSAIGQQRRGRNVQRGTPESLMSGTGAWVVLRYTGAGSGGGAAPRPMVV